LTGRVQPKTIKSYLSAVHSMHTDMDLPFTACESLLVQRLIRGIKRYHGERNCKPKQPITFPVLLDVLRHLIPGSDEHAAWVAITVAAAPGTPSCPVAALKALFERSPRTGESPLFENPDGTVLHRGRFIAALRLALLAAGYNASLYAGHSFRRGAASSAAAAGFNDYKIQLLGRWRSDTYKLYIEADASQVI
ncbi:hypothetical protein FIBSPDRAFT_753452, partial [Athelia psychrophila]